MRKLLRHNLVLWIAFVFAVSGLNVFAAPIMASPAYCSPAGVSDSQTECPHCTTGTGNCICGQTSPAGSEMSVCHCGEDTSERVPLPGSVPQRVDTHKQLCLAPHAVSGVSILNPPHDAVALVPASAGESCPIYLWNCTLRT